MKIINDGTSLYCIGEVEAGKVYKVVGKPDKRIYFRYVITEDTHNVNKFVGTPVDIMKGEFTHIIRPTVSGHLCVKSLKNQSDYWQEIQISVEEQK